MQLRLCSRSLLESGLVRNGIRLRLCYVQPRSGLACPVRRLSSGEKPLMAGDPEPAAIRRVAPPVSRKTGKPHESSNAGAHIAFPSQHLRQVLHFVLVNSQGIEGPHAPVSCRSPRDPAFAGNDGKNGDGPHAPTMTGERVRL